MSKKTVRDLRNRDLEGRPVLVRVDMNVPLDEGRIADETRIRSTLPTLQTLLAQEARPVILSHLGRPDARPDPALSLRPVAQRLGELLGREVRFCPEPAGPRVEEAVDALPGDAVLLLENTRFLPGETKNDPELASEWGSLSRIYVNDAFGTAHRAHASTVGVPESVRKNGGEAVAGLLMEKELEFLDEKLRDPERPFLALLGGVKITGKVELIHALLSRADHLLIGGAMANTFFLALGLEVGGSRVEEDRVGMAWELLEHGGDRLHLPVDCVVGDRLEKGVETRTADRDGIGPKECIGDIGLRTRRIYRDRIANSRTVLWNGPMGVFEVPGFEEGTMEIAHAMAEAGDRGSLTVVGGGDSVSAVERAGVGERLSHRSTGGGAALELLAGSPLPGVEALSDR